MNKKALIAILVLFVLAAAAAWAGGGFVWRTLRAMHGAH